jgi:NIPSNAP
MFGDPMTRLFWLALSIIAILVLAHFALADEPAADSSGRVFEIRTYTAEDGKLDALSARFRDHTIKLFEKHGITSIGYWIPADEPRSKNTLIYIVAHPSREAAKQHWEEFGQDPEWQKVKAESEAGGKLVTKVDSVFVNPTDYSPLK